MKPDLVHICNNCPYLAAQRSRDLFNAVETILRSIALHGENEYNLEAKKVLLGKLK